MEAALPSPRRSRRLLAVLVGLALGLGLVVLVLLLPDRGPRPAAYVVVRGDTLGRIAEVHGVTVAQLMSWNDLDSDLIQVGQVLLIRTEQSAETTPSGGGRPARPVASRGPSRGLPPELPCLAPPDPEALVEGDEPSFLASQGLDHGQLEGAMQAFLPRLYGCVPEGERPDGVLTLELTVACSGRVADLRVLDAGALPDALVACVVDEARYAGFPAHDMPDGFTFHYPVSFRW